MLRKLRIKFICVTMSIVLLMLCIMFSVLYFSTRRSLREESMRIMQSIADDPVKKDRPGFRRNDAQIPYFFVDIGADGEIKRTNSELFSITDTEQLKSIADAAEGRAEPAGELEEYGLRFCKRVTPMGETLVFADVSAEKLTLKKLVENCVMIGLAAVAAFFLLSVLLARRAVKPVEEAWQQQKQFSADASHELKTPLTIIMTSTELLSGGDCTEEEKAVLTGRIRTAAGQMRELVEELLTIARLDSGVSAAKKENISLSETVQDAVLPFEPIFFENGLSLSADIEPGITVKADGAKMSRLAGILLDNAVKYSVPGGKTEVRLFRSSRGRCVLSVANEGEPISDEDLKNIFKRFYRADKVRTMSGSSGLGLSIAEGIAEEHGGKIHAESQNGVNTFIFELPV